MRIMADILTEIVNKRIADIKKLGINFGVDIQFSDRERSYP